MKTIISVITSGLLAASVITFSSCNKETASADTASSSASSDITVASSATVATADSVVIEHDCGRGGKRDSIAESSLPAAVGTYLAANYSGYTFHEAFSQIDSTGTVNGYVVIIYYNDLPVGLKFDSSGTFTEILRQRQHRHGHR